MTKAHQTGQSIHMALQIYRNTPLSATINSPMQLLFQMLSRTNLPISTLAEGGQILSDGRSGQLLKKPKLQKAKEGLHTGQPEMVQDPQSKTWDEGTITNAGDEHQSYDVQVGTGEYQRS